MTEPSLDDRLQVLADQRRRRIVRQLRDGDSHHSSLDELTDELECQDPERTQVAISLHHNHLPKLDSHGLLDYDRDTGHVEYRPGEEAEQLLEQLPEEAPTTKI